MRERERENETQPGILTIMLLTDVSRILISTLKELCKKVEWAMLDA